MAIETGAGALYDEAVKAQAKAAIGKGRLPRPDAEVTVDNPLCGDRVTMGVTLDGDRVVSIGHVVRGCLLCEAAASLIGQAIPGQDKASLQAGLATLDSLLGGQVVDDDTAAASTPWQGLTMFAPVSAYRSRHRCVRLPFEALVDAVSLADEKATLPSD